MKFRLPHTATYWAPAAPDEYGQTTFAAPVSLACRWQDVAQMFRDANGNDQVSRAVVYFKQAVARQGWLFEGVSAATDPRTEAGAAEIRQVGKSDNLQGSQTLVKVFL